MAALLKFQARPTAVAERVVDPFLALPLAAREEAQRCLGIIRPAVERVRGGVSIRAAAEWLHSAYPEGESTRTLQRWITDYCNGGIVALAPANKGRQRKDRGWEARALHLFNQPQRPSYATVALWLRQEGFESASEHLVRRYLKSVPSSVAETGRKRVGGHYYDQNIRPYKVRDASVLPVGLIYEGDGHTCDVYVAHPNTGRAYRPELTVWVDVRSHYVVGWWLSESESAETTLFSLSHALISLDHTPAYVHADVGSGFKARLMTDEVSGYFARFAITPIFALPGNAKGKGLIEGFFRWFEERCGKRFSTFCGHCRTDDALRHLREKTERGLVKLPSLVEYAEAVRDYFAFYNGNPQQGLGNQSPADLWTTLERTPLETPSAAVVRPREQRTVRRWSIALHGRTYRADELASYEGRSVLVEYSLHDDARVWVFDDKGRFACEAVLTEKMPWLSDSRIEEGLQRRAEGQAKRLEAKLAEVQARARRPISGSNVLDALEGHVAPEPVALPTPFHSPAPAPRVLPRPVPTETLARLDAEQREAAAEAQSLETPEARFARARRLIDHGCSSEAEQQWLAIYQTSPEFHSRMALLDEFGPDTVPGTAGAGGADSRAQNHHNPLSTPPRGGASH